MKTVSMLLVAALAAVGCDRGVYTDAGTRYVVPMAAAIDPDPALQSWIAYSLARSTCQLMSSQAEPARHDSFECERRARTRLAEAWIERTLDDPGLQDDYLDALASVYEAGYVPEYTWHFLRRPAWSGPEALDIDAFERWRGERLPGHRPLTRRIGYWVD